MKNCTDCKLELEMIRILDATDVAGWRGDQGSSNIDLHYAPWHVDLGTSPIPGAQPITGWICPKCRKISLYG